MVDQVGQLSLPRMGMRSLRRGVLDATLALFAVVSLSTLLAQWFWLPDMLNFFRPVLFYLSVLVAGAAWMQRQRARIVLALALVLFNLAPLVVPAASAPAAVAPGAPTIRVMSSNVRWDNKDYDAFRRAVAAIEPDVLVVQEAIGPWMKVLRGLDALPYKSLDPEGKGFSKGTERILSRFPLKVTPIGPNMSLMRWLIGGGQALRVEVMPPGRPPFVVYAIHPPTPRTDLGWRRRAEYLDEIASVVRAEPPGTPVIVAGDWNTPPWSPLFGRFMRETGLASAEALPWPSATRVLFSLEGATLLGAPIDRVVVSPEIGVAGFHRGPAFGSDHLPVYADVAVN